jgi:hypothetical protein
MRNVVLLFAFLSFNAFADPYFGASFGLASVEIERANIPGTVETIDDTDIGLRIFAGMSLNPNISLEFGYLDGGGFSQHITDGVDTVSLKVTGSAIDLSVVGKSDAGFYGRIGLYRASFKGTVSVNGSTASDTVNNSDILFGLGIEAPLNNIRLRIEYTKYLGVGNDDFGKTDVDFISVGLVVPIR